MKLSPSRKNKVKDKVSQKKKVTVSVSSIIRAINLAGFNLVQDMKNGTVYLVAGYYKIYSNERIIK